MCGNPYMYFAQAASSNLRFSTFSMDASEALSSMPARPCGECRAFPAQRPRSATGQSTRRNGYAFALGISARNGRRPRQPTGKRVKGGLPHSAKLELQATKVWWPTQK